MKEARRYERKEIMSNLVKYSLLDREIEREIFHTEGNTTVQCYHGLQWKK